MRRLPPVRVALPDARAQNRQDRPHLQGERQLDGKAISEVYRQAGTGGVLLSSMGNPEPYPIYWDKMLINASQVTNPSIDPLREPMETRTFLGKKPGKIERDRDGRLVPNLSPQLELNVPVMFSAMSYGSISYNAHASLAPRGLRARHLL